MRSDILSTEVNVTVNKRDVISARCANLSVRTRKNSHCEKHSADMSSTDKHQENIVWSRHFYSFWACFLWQLMSPLENH